MRRDVVRRDGSRELVREDTLAVLVRKDALALVGEEVRKVFLMVEEGV